MDEEDTDCAIDVLEVVVDGIDVPDVDATNEDEASDELDVLGSIRVELAEIGSVLFVGCSLLLLLVMLLMCLGFRIGDSSHLSGLFRLFVFSMKSLFATLLFISLRMVVGDSAAGRLLDLG